MFDFEAIRAYPALLEPLLFYLLHRVTARIQDPAEASTLKLCVMDEAWRFIQHPTLRAYVQEGLKTWRKRNAAMILSTQAIEDFASADLLRTVVESCPTKLFLANPAFDARQYAELFQLNDRELERLPPYIEGLVRAETETYAGTAGVHLITVSIFQEARNRGKVSWSGSASERLAKIPAADLAGNTSSNSSAERHRRGQRSPARISRFIDGQAGKSQPDKLLAALLQPDRAGVRQLGVRLSDLRRDCHFPSCGRLHRGH